MQVECGKCQMLGVAAPCDECFYGRLGVKPIDDEPEDPDNVDTSPMCPCGTCPDTGPFPCVRRD